MGGYPYQLHLMFTEKNRDRIMRSIKADTSFLRSKGIMDYSLLMVCEEIDFDDEKDIYSHFKESGDIRLSPRSVAVSPLSQHSAVTLDEEN